MPDARRQDDLQRFCGRIPLHASGEKMKRKHYYVVPERRARVAARLILRLLILYGFALVKAAHGQRVNTQFVDQFPGATVAAKVAAAQAACNSSIPCVLVFDADLFNYPQGSIPAQGANETWMRF